MLKKTTRVYNTIKSQQKHTKKGLVDTQTNKKAQPSNMNA